MKLSLSAYKPAEAPMVNVPGGFNLGSFSPRSRKEKVVIVMGATGTGKSRLSIDLATRFSAEVINSDKMQAYHGLDITTNKVTAEECRGVPHHLLGVVHDPDADFSAADFRRTASFALDSIASRDRLPIIAGGSNSYIESLVNENLLYRSRFECCFLWVHVSLPVLYSFVSNRVDRMVEAGLVDEVGAFFDPNANYSQGLRRAIGVPELDLYFRTEGRSDKKRRGKLLQNAIREIKNNNCKLACKQFNKIRRLSEQWGIEMHRLDATEVFLNNGRAADEAWESLILRPSTAIVNRFLSKENNTIFEIPAILTQMTATASVR